MAGLGLAQGIRDYQNTYQNQVQFQRQQEQVQRQRKMQADIDAANKAAMDVIAQSQQEWQAQGAPGEYRPNAETFFRAAEARGNHLAKAGLFDAFMENEARVAPMKLRARTEALQRYQTDGDFDRLARSVYPTLFDGMTIKGSEVVGGNDDSAGPPEAPKYKFKLSNGSDVVLEPAKLVATLKASLVDYGETAKREAMLNYERAKTEIRTAGRLKEIDAQGKNSLAVANVQGQSRENVADINGQYRVDAAEVRGQYGNETARIRGQFQELSAKARGPSGGGRTADDVQRFKALELAARSHMESIRKEIATNETALKDAGRDARPRYEAKLAALHQELADARNTHTEILDGLRQPASAGAGLSDAKPSGGVLSDDRSPKYDANAERAKAAKILKANPGARDEVLRRLKGAGINTDGL